MKVLHTIAEVRAARAGYPRLGFVPTMGALHEGHLSLVRAARARCGAAAVSIFVNPTQFNDKSDFARYPRTLEADVALLAQEGCDLVFAPGANELYPQGFATRVDVGPVSAPLEGAARPGHFTGVATVVAKLLNIVQPTEAFFGQKDAQQVAVIRRLARDLDLPTQIVALPTVREADGLAMSSRNVHLSPQDRAAAIVIYRALNAAQKAFEEGERDGEKLRALMRAILAQETRGVVEYVSVAHPGSLEESGVIGAEGALASLAVRFGATRLIDNVILGG
ncbi:MAG: pantoate--beta-alanine ligase [Hyphomonadaceae bacterium]